MIRTLVSIINFLQKRDWIRFFGVREPRRLGFQKQDWKKLVSKEQPSTWFHASSLGELEMLFPLIEDFHSRGLQVGVSAFSDSALSGLKKLNGICVYSGLSPSESDWAALFKQFKVERVVLSKYDAWPGLVLAASDLGIPMMMVNAELRSSIRVLHSLFRMSFRRFPDFYFFANQESMVHELQEFLPEAKVKRGVDPRFERVARRLRSERNPRLQEWSKKISELEGEVGIVGSAWLEDLWVLVPAFKRFPGSLVVVPHDLTAPNLKRIQDYLEIEIPGRYIVVNEMGLLTELYAEGDWAWVGGGFGKGIHSTLEPALSGIPVASGPKNFERFSETRELVDLGVLTCCHDSIELQAWFSKRNGDALTDDFYEQKRKQYQALLEDCLVIR
jgi:3-deoxy-D-manno-octulosonic-acid transferase